MHADGLTQGFSKSDIVGSPQNLKTHIFCNVTTLNILNCNMKKVHINGLYRSYYSLSSSIWDSDASGFGTTVPTMLCRFNRK